MASFLVFKHLGNIIETAVLSLILSLGIVFDVQKRLKDKKPRPVVSSTSGCFAFKLDITFTTPFWNDINDGLG